MSAKSASSRISSTRPKSVSCRYQSGASLTVSDNTRLSSASASGGSGSFGIALLLLAPVAFEAEVRLVERRGTQVCACAFTLARLEVGARGRDEVRLAHPGAHALGPHREIVARPLDVLRHVFDSGDDAEVDQRQLLGLVAEDVVERLLPSLEVDLRRGRVRDDVLAREDPNAGRVAGEQRTV